MLCHTPRCRVTGNLKGNFPSVGLGSFIFYFVSCGVPSFGIGLAHHNETAFGPSVPEANFPQPKVKSTYYSV